MMTVMRTTVNLEPSILENAKAASIGRGVTLSELLEDALRAYLSPTNQAAAGPFRLHTVRGQLVQPGLDLDRSSALVVADDELTYGKSQ
jgi:hypothetical protein